MQCPSCNEDIDDHAVVCPHCDTIVDPSAFDDAPRPGRSTSGQRKAPVKSGVRPATPGAKKRRTRPSDTRGPEPRSAEARAKRAESERPDSGPADTLERPPKSGSAAGDWKSKLSPEDWEQGPRAPPPDRLDPERAMDADDLMSAVKQFVYALSPGDKLAFFGLVAIVISCFFPWKETVADGEVLGLAGPGLVTFLMACISLTSLVLRVNRSFKLNELLLWAGQLGALFIGVIWALISIVQSWNPTLARAVEGNQEVWASKPSFGVILAILSAGLTGFGTVLGLKGR